MSTEVQAQRLPGPPGKAPATQILIDLLSQRREPMTDEKMSRLCGRDTRTGGKGYQNLLGAIRYVRKHHGLDWKRVAGASCIECLSASKSLAAASADRASIRRKSKKTMLRLATIEGNDLSENEQRTHHAMIAQVGSLLMFTDGSTTKSLEARNVAKPLDRSRMLEAIV